MIIEISYESYREIRQILCKNSGPWPFIARLGKDGVEETIDMHGVEIRATETPKSEDMPVCH